MLSVLYLFFSTMFLVFRSQAALQVENLALRHQIGVLRRSAKKRPKLTVADRVLWAWLSGAWADWRSALVVVKPETVIAWHRKGFRAVLDLEGPARTNRKAGRLARSPESDPHHEPRQPIVGCTAHPRRITQARY
jgi:hypothetical protein